MKTRRCRSAKSYQIPSLGTSPCGVHEPIAMVKVAKIRCRKHCFTGALESLQKTSWQRVGIVRKGSGSRSAHGRSESSRRVGGATTKCLSKCAPIVVKRCQCAGWWMLLVSAAEKSWLNVWRTKYLEACEGKGSAVKKREGRSSYGWKRTVHFSHYRF